MKVKLKNKKMGLTDKTGNWVPRVYHRSSRGRKGPRYLIKCGCCEESIEIYYGEGSLEIGGVNASVEDWRKILLPLLK